jgi:hypothetical protein
MWHDDPAGMRRLKEEQEKDFATKQPLVGKYPITWWEMTFQLNKEALARLKELARSHALTVDATPGMLDAFRGAMLSLPGDPLGADLDLGLAIGIKELSANPEFRMAMLYLLIAEDLALPGPALAPGEEECEGA